MAAQPVRDGVCQRCGRGAFSFCILQVGDARRWAGAYIGGAPPDTRRMTCLLCLTPPELERVRQRNEPGAVDRLREQLARHLGDEANA